jgi:sec-independent protein translocase protein TatA
VPTIGPLELAVFAVILLLLFGAKRLPELGRSLGTGARELKDALTVSEKRTSRDAGNKKSST